MKTIIETDETDLASIYFKSNENIIEWKDLSREDQIKITDALSKFSNLLFNSVKP